MQNMKYFYICSTSYLTIKEKQFDIDFEDFHFSDSMAFLKNLNNKFCIVNLGLNHYPRINAPYFYDSFSNTIKKNERIEVSENYSQYFQLLISNLWFIKDCSCNTRELIEVFIDEKKITTRSRTSVFSNSKGEYLDEEFTLEELKKVEKLTDKIIEIKAKLDDGIIKTKISKSTGNILVGNSNLLLYKKRNRIERCIDFLTIARTTSFLPLKISFYIGTLETLFTTDNGEVTHKVSERLSFYLQNEFDKLETYKFIKQCYNIRSKFMHGQIFSENTEILSQYSEKIDNILRVLLNKIIVTDFEIFMKKDEDLIKYFNELIFT